MLKPQPKTGHKTPAAGARKPTSARREQRPTPRSGKRGSLSSRTCPGSRSPRPGNIGTAARRTCSGSDSASPPAIPNSPSRNRGSSAAGCSTRSGIVAMDAGPAAHRRLHRRIDADAIRVPAPPAAAGSKAPSASIAAPAAKRVVTRIIALLWSGEAVSQSNIVQELISQVEEAPAASPPQWPCRHHTCAYSLLSRSIAASPSPIASARSPAWP